MKAIIMAGGKGTRLRPLTCDCPKPMMRLMDTPIMEYAVRLLRQYGIADAAVTLGYLPEAIKSYFGDGTDFGVRLKYYLETAPLGTAGGVKQARDLLNETFLVLSGDGVTDLDINEAYGFHKSRSALATIVLKRVESPLEYGVVTTMSDGRVLSFTEKPNWSDAVSDTVNTGIYIIEPELLDMIPDGEYDFGSKLFPELVSAGKPVYGYITDKYWCDIGDTGAYLKAHFDAFDGKFSLIDKPGIAEDALVDDNAIIEAPVFIGAGARVMAGARVGAYSVLCAGSRVEKGADIKRAILLSGARVCENAQARMCVLSRDSTLKPSSEAYDECVLGTGAELAENARLISGAKLWPYKRVAEGETRSENLIWGVSAGVRFVNGALPLNNPAEAARAAEAMCALIKPKEVMLARTPSAVAAALSHAATAGFMAQGARVLDMGAGTLPQLRFMQQRLKCPLATYISDAQMLPLAECGAELCAKQQRAAAGLLLRHDYSEAFTGITRMGCQLGRTDIEYAAYLANAFTSDARYAPSIAVFSERMELLDLAERAMRRAGLSVRAEWEEDMMELDAGEMGVYLSDTGENANLADAGSRLADAECELALAWTALESGDKRLILPTSYTRAINALADNYSATVVYLPLNAANFREAQIRESPKQFTLMNDGILLAISLASQLAEKRMSLSELRRSFPKVHRHRSVVELPYGERGRALRMLAENESPEFGGGMRLEREGGWAMVFPDDSGLRLSILAESDNAEYAEELCYFFDTQLRRGVNK